MRADTLTETPSITTDLCVIGAGAAGLSVASTAALLGVPVVLIEKGAMGGECLNVGCVPSKAMIAAANTAHTIRHAGVFGVASAGVSADWDGVMRHVQSVIKGIAPVDSVERYRALGAKVIEGEARFIDKASVRVGDKVINARRFVIATGSQPAIPPIPGLADVASLTNETIFTLAEKPQRLAIIGGGPIGVELAQAHRRLGCDVTLIEAGSLLGREDPELADVARRALLLEGIHIFEKATIEKVQPLKAGVSLDIKVGDRREIVNASHVLVATGRRPRLEGLGLETAGVSHTAAGIVVDRGLRTSNRKIYALGDCIDGPKFTHAAGYQAGLVVRNALFRLPVKVDYAALPRVTYCQPEIAAVGLSEAEAHQQLRSVSVLRFPFAENDRARTERNTAGLVKVMIDRKGRVLGAAIAGPHAGEMIGLWTLAVRQKQTIGAIIDTVFAYPTFSEASRRAALQALGPKLRSPWLPRILRFLRALG